MSDSVNREDWLTETLDEIANKCLGVKYRSTYVPSTMADEISSKMEAAKRRIDLLAQQLEAERAKVANLSALFREGIGISFDGGDWCGSDIQDKAEELGLIREEKYDPEKHSALGSFDGDSGDSIYIINDDALAALQAPEAKP
jgi:hypothetical protein